MSITGICFTGEAPLVKLEKRGYHCCKLRLWVKNWKLSKQED